MSCLRHKRTSRVLIRLVFILLLSAPILLSSCALTRPREKVILKPFMVGRLPGERPWLFVRFLPYEFKDHIVELVTPDGNGAYLEIGPALAASYENALRGVFDVNFTQTGGVGQLAFIDFYFLKFHSELEGLVLSSGGNPGRAFLTLKLTHSVKIVSRNGQPVEDIPIDVTIRKEVEYYDERDYLDAAQKLAADLLIKLQQDLLEYTERSDRAGLYIYR